MATCKVKLELSDGTDKDDLSVIVDNDNVILGSDKHDTFDISTDAWWWTRVIGANSSITIAGDGKASFHAEQDESAVLRDDSMAGYSGDFLVEFEFENAAESGTTVRADIIQLRAWFNDGAIERIDAYRVYVPPATDEHRFVQEVKSVGALQSSNVVDAATSGGFRIVRIGDNAIVYYKNTLSGEWIRIDASLKTINTSVTLDYIELSARNITTGDVDVDVISYRFIPLGSRTDNEGQLYFDDSNPQPNSVNWNSYIIGSTVDMSTIDIIEGGTGSSKYQYAKNNGALNGVWLTLAELQAETNFTVIHANSLKVVTQFISDGTQTVIIGRVGSVELDVPSVIVQGPLQTIQTRQVEVFQL